VQLRQAIPRRPFCPTPGGKVPVLRTGDLLIWDSLAIIEYVADLYPDRPVWPREPDRAGIARSVSAEMHSGFNSCARSVLWTFCVKADADLSGRGRAQHPPYRAELQGVPDRIRVRRTLPVRLVQCGGCMYAPVCSRFRTYVPDLRRFGDDGTAADYVETIFAMPEMAAWAEGGARIEAPAEPPGLHKRGAQPLNLY